MFFETKNFVNLTTKSPDDYNKFLEREKMMQGKEYKKEEKVYKNYKVLQQELKDKKVSDKKQKKEDIETGMYNYDRERKLAMIEDNKRKVNAFLHHKWHGAPNDIGRANHLGRFKSTAIGGVGSWKGGQLKLSAKDVRLIQSKPRF